MSKRTTSLDDELPNAAIEDEHGRPVAKTVSLSSLAAPTYSNRRASSPSGISLASIEDFSELRISRTNSRQPEPFEEIKLNEKPSTWRRKAVAFWIRNKGMALVIAAELFNTLMAVSTRLLVTDGTHGKGMHPFQILFARFAITCTMASLYMWYNNTPDFPFGAKGVRALLVARGMGGFFGVFGLYWSLQYLPIADAVVITFIAPFVACLICAKLMHEPFTRSEQICGLLALAGIVLIARPTALFSSSSSVQAPADTSTNSTAPLNSTTPNPPPSNVAETVSPHMRLAAVGMALLGVCGAACAYTTIRWIGQRAHPLISVNYFSVWCLIVSTVCVVFVPGVDFVLPHNLMEWGLLVWIGASGFVMQFLLTAGLAYSKDSRATHMVYTQMIFALAFDKLIWNVTPGVLEVVGSSLILGSAIFVAVHKGAGEKEKAVVDEGAVDVALAQRDEERGLVEGMDSEEEHVGEEEIEPPK